LEDTPQAAPGTRAINLGIIGAGLAIKRLHWPPLSRLGDRFKVVAIADTSPEAAQEVAQLAGGCPTTRDYRDLLADPGVEAVLVALPIHLNAQVIMESVRAGKHVLCEKPIASNLEQARQVLDALRGTRPIVIIGENFHYSRDFTRARQLIDEGRLGRVFLIDVSCYYWTDISEGFASTYWRQDSQYRGGAVTDASVHHAALLRELGGEVEQLQAFTKLVHPDMSGIDTIVLNLRYRSGALGRLLFAAAAVEAETPFANATVFGTEGTLHLTDGKLRLHRVDSKDELVENYEDDDSYYDQLMNFYDAIVNGAPVICTPEQAYRDLEILMRAYDSAETRTVALLP